MVNEVGLQATAKEYGIMDIVKELHSLSAELKKSHLTVEEAKTGLKAAVAFEECGVQPEEYQDIVDTCLKTHNEGFLAAAMELHKIEESSGMTFDEIVKQASASKGQLQSDKKELLAVQEQIGQAKKTLVTWDHKKTGAEKDLQQFMQKVGVDYQRLEKVENLAMALKKAGVTDETLGAYVQRQNLLNGANISIDVFVKILNLAKVPTAADGGKNLFKRLTEYGNLDETIIAMKQEKQLLTNDVKDLGEKAKLKGELNTEITHLQAQKKELEGSMKAIDNLYDFTSKRVKKLQADINSLLEYQANINTDISQKEEVKKKLSDEIESKQQKVADLASIEAKRDAAIAKLADVNAEIAKLDAQAEAKKQHLAVCEAIEGYIQSTSLEKQGKFIAMLPKLLEEVKQREYSKNFIRAYIFKELTGGTLRVLQCVSCGARFFVDKPAEATGYLCPVCGIREKVFVDKDEVDILIAALANTKSMNVVYGTKIQLMPPSN